MIVLHCYDDNPCKPEDMTPKALSPTHCFSIGNGGTIEYVYQAEEWVRQVEEDHREVVRVECPTLGRTWVRRDGKMVEG